MMSFPQNNGSNFLVLKNILEGSWSFFSVKGGGEDIWEDLSK